MDVKSFITLGPVRGSTRVDFSKFHSTLQRNKINESGKKVDNTLNSAVCVIMIYKGTVFYVLS